MLNDLKKIKKTGREHNYIQRSLIFILQKKKKE
jgi:hypothetical protein